MDEIDFPDDVTSWLSSVFSQCNRHVTAKLCNNPNMQEEWLDYSWIEQISLHATPRVLASEWVVRMEAHYLGGMRHFLSWEIADIGVLLFIRSPTQVLRRKVALLQSKRLYPVSGGVLEETESDYQVGFYRLADPENEARSLQLERDFQFSFESKYRALMADADQVRAIKSYEETNQTPVYYQFYNPWELPFSRRVPISEFWTPEGLPDIGVRVVPASTVRGVLQGRKTGHSPSIADLAGSAPDDYGWRLETFLVEEFLACREGKLWDSPDDGAIRSLFFRRSGPISAAVSITIETPPGLLD